MPRTRPGASPREDHWKRREVLLSGVALGASLLGPGRLRAESTFSLPVVAKRALDSSPLVYVCPLRADGSESRCHGEVWFFHDGGDVVLATAKETWKARALAKGLDEARIWVGDFGPVARAKQRYRTAPEFKARAAIDAEPPTFERLMTRFATKYPDEWSKWKPRFRKGYEDGTRILLRYTPIAP